MLKSIVCSLLCRCRQQHLTKFKLDWIRTHWITTFFPHSYDAPVTFIQGHGHQNGYKSDTQWTFIIKWSLKELAKSTESAETKEVATNLVELQEYQRNQSHLKHPRYNSLWCMGATKTNSNTSTTTITQITAQNKSINKRQHKQYKLLSSLC